MGLPKRKTVALPELPPAMIPLAAILSDYALATLSVLSATPSGTTPVST